MDEVPSSRAEAQDDDKWAPAMPVVAIGSSAGGLEAMRALFSELGTPDAAFVVIAHRAVAAASHLPGILASHTSMTVVEPETEAKLEPRTVYVVPPGKLLSFHQGSLRVVEVEQSERFSPIDQLFRALAALGEHAVAVVLSGNGQDGCVGVKDVKAAGGLVLIQDPSDARYRAMPEAVLASVPVDHQASAHDLGPALVRLLKLVAEPKTHGVILEPLERRFVERILTRLLDVTGHDFTSYKRSTVSRRIQRRIQVLGLESPDSYYELLQRRPAELELLFGELLIGVTSFFRDPEAFEVLAQTLEPYLQRDPLQRELRVWVPACSTGEEAYSIAILIREILERAQKQAQVQIFATDIDPAAVQSARMGRYPPGVAADISEERLRRFFVVEENSLRVCKEIREMLVFAPQNLVKDPPFTRLDLLACRNMLIYLEPELQKKVLSLFHYALLPDGLLFLGSSESLGSLDDAFSTVDKKWKVFANRSARRGHRINGLRLEMPPPSKPQDEHAAQYPIGAIKRGVGAIVDRILLANVPPSALVTARGDIAYIHGRTGKFLEPAAGEPNANIFDMAREGLRLELPAALREAVHQDQPLVRHGLQVRTNGGFEHVTLSVTPLSEPDAVAGMLLVTFDVRAAAPVSVQGDQVPSDLAPQRVAQLEAELVHARENLQGTIEEFETSNEELKSMNEELQSTNEELQSANEELETSREEMQSMNEELQTLNAELQDRNEELSQINDDMQNLLNSTDVATLFLDRELRIKRFTAPAGKVFHLRDSDIGRPLGDMAASLLYGNLIEDARHVLRTLVFREQEVEVTNGGWRLMRILPYRTAHDVIDGLVITFLDIDQLKQAEQRAQRARSVSEVILAALSEALVVCDAARNVLSANTAFYKTFGGSDKSTLGEPLRSLGLGLSHPELGRRLDALERGEPFEPLRLNASLDGDGQKDLLFRAFELTHSTTDGRFVLVVEDLAGRQLPLATQLE